MAPQDRTRCLPRPTRCAPTCSRARVHRARSSVRAPTSSTGRSAARSLAFVAEVGFEGKRGEALAVPTGGQLGAKAAVLVGHGRRRHARRRRAAPGRRRARPPRRRRSRRSRPRCSTPRPTSSTGPTPRRRSPKASCSARYQFLTYKSDAKPTKLARVQVLGRANAKVRDGLARGARVARGGARGRATS